MHTAPPLPLFAHCAQDWPQPPLATPAQLKTCVSAAVQVPLEGIPNCCNTGGGGGGGKSVFEGEALEFDPDKEMKFAREFIPDTYAEPLSFVEYHVGEVVVEMYQGDCTGLSTAHTACDVADALVPRAPTQ